MRQLASVCVVDALNRMVASKRELLLINVFVVVSNHVTFAFRCLFLLPRQKFPPVLPLLPTHLALPGVAQSTSTNWGSSDRVVFFHFLQKCGVYYDIRIRVIASSAFPCLNETLGCYVWVSPCQPHS